MKASIIIVISIILVSCASTKGMEKTKVAMDSWLGSSTQTLIKEWGAPSRVTTDGAGGEVLVYERSTYLSYYKVTYYTIRMFYAHADGIIYHWKAENGNR